MSWFYLLIASVFEIAWVIALKRVKHWTDFIDVSITIVLLLLSVGFLSLALKSIPVGMAYAIWTGIGIIGAVILGVVYYKEPINLVGLLCIGLILVGIAGLRLTQTIHH